MLETKSIIKDIRQPAEIKDMIKDKTSKLSAAVYLVTNFLDDLDQIKWKLRHKTLDLRANLTLGVKDAQTPSVWPIERILSDINEILSLIDIAVLDRRASPMNFSILRQGYLSLQTEFQNYINGDWYKNMLIPALSSKITDLSPRITKEVRLPLGSRTSNSARREKIVTFIKQHNWSSIKDVAKSIPGVGAKTIQRELAGLVKTGVLKKEGERRWSRYSTVS